MGDHWLVIEEGFDPLDDAWNDGIYVECRHERDGTIGDCTMLFDASAYFDTTVWWDQVTAEVHYVDTYGPSPWDVDHEGRDGRVIWSVTERPTRIRKCARILLEPAGRRECHLHFEIDQIGLLDMLDGTGGYPPLWPLTWPTKPGRYPVHLVSDGFGEGYTCWLEQGEEPPSEAE